MSNPVVMDLHELTVKCQAVVASAMQAAGIPVNCVDLNRVLSTTELERARIRAEYVQRLAAGDNPRDVRAELYMKYNMYDQSTIRKMLSNIGMVL